MHGRRRVGGRGAPEPELPWVSPVAVRTPFDFEVHCYREEITLQFASVRVKLPFSISSVFGIAALLTLAPFAVETAHWADITSIYGN